MAFHETPRFPDRIAYGATGGPGFSTSVAVLSSGREARNGNWQYPRHAWDVSQGIKSQADFETVRAFFMSKRGRLHGWRFKDWGDYTCTVADGRATALTSTTFQLIKRYTSGSESMDRLIQKPVTGTVAVFVSAVPATFTVDTTTGIVTIAAAPAAADITWSGEFDVPMRFDTDQLQGRMVARNMRAGLLHEWGQIPIVEVPV
jgi:uncharacterized protein (TIGR02217 family)